MPSPVPQATRLNAIVAAIKTRIADGLGVNESFIRLVASDDYKVTITEPLFVVLRVYGPGSPGDPGLAYTDSGGGRRARFVGRRLRTYLYTRSGVDIVGGDEIALLGSEAITDPNVVPPNGHFKEEERLFDLLDDWMPTRAGRGLTIGPLHPLDSAGGPPERKPENDAGLIRSMLDWEIVYQLYIDPTEPPS